MERFYEFFRANTGYIIGGCITIMTFLFIINVEIPANPNIVYALIGFGIALGVGFAIRDLASFLGIVSIVRNQEFPRLYVQIYNLFL
jgi:hypothetical protein